MPGGALLFVNGSAKCLVGHYYLFYASRFLGSSGLGEFFLATCVLWFDTFQVKKNNRK